MNTGKVKGNVISVVNYGANGKDTKDDEEAIQSALDEANKSSQAMTVVIPQGTYYLGKAICVGSNTTIDATGATIISRYMESNGKGCMLKTIHHEECGSSCTHGGYSQAENITVIGGIWDRNSQLHANDTGDVNSILYLPHCKGITVKNATFKNGSNHYLDFSASDDITIEGCTLQDQVEPTTTSDSFWGSYEVGDTERFHLLEAIHLDSATKNGEPRAYPHDNTEARNVIIKDCRFDHLYAGIGNHHKNSVNTANVKITGNSFDNMEYKCCSIFAFENTQISNNKADNSGIYFTDIRYSSGIAVSENVMTDVQQGVRIRNSSCTVTNNDMSLKKITKGDKNGIYVHDDSVVTIDQNQIKNAQTSGIRAKGSQVTITNNTISGAGNGGVYIENNEYDAVISGNTISQCDNYSIVFKNSSKADIKNNTVEGKPNGIDIDTCDSVMIQGNSCKSQEASGISVKNSPATEIKDNTVEGKQNGIDIDTCDSALIEDNTCRSDLSYGILAEGSIDRLTKVIIDHNDVQSYNADYDIFLDEYCHDCEVTDNIISPKGILAQCELLKNEKNGAVNQIKCSNLTVEGSKTAKEITLKPVASGGIITFASSNPKLVVSASGTITLPKYYSGTFTVKITAEGEGYLPASTSAKVLVKPSPTDLKSLKKTGKGSFTVKWTKNSYANGYELQYSKSSKFKNATTKKITKNTTVSRKITKLKTKKVYYVRVRTYKKINGKVYRSPWTKGKKVKV